MWTQHFATSHLGLAFESKPAAVGWLGEGHGQETLAMSQAWGRAGGWYLNPGGSRYARHAQAPRKIGHYQVLMND